MHVTSCESEVRVVRFVKGSGAVTTALQLQSLEAKRLIVRRPCDVMRPSTMMVTDLLFLTRFAPRELPPGHKYEVRYGRMVQNTSHHHMSPATLVFYSWHSEVGRVLRR
jgi:hypothetical protein